MRTYQAKSTFSVLQKIMKKLKKNYNNQLNEIKTIWKQLETQTAYEWLKAGTPKLIKENILFVQIDKQKKGFEIKYKEQEIIKLFNQFNIKKIITI